MAYRVKMMPCMPGVDLIPSSYTFGSSSDLGRRLEGDFYPPVLTAFPVLYMAVQRDQCVYRRWYCFSASKSEVVPIFAAQSNSYLYWQTHQNLYRYLQIPRVMYDQREIYLAMMSQTMVLEPRVTCDTRTSSIHFVHVPSHSILDFM